MKKYLIFLSYIGHEFRGMQKQPINCVNGKMIKLETVQEHMEVALKTTFKLLHDVNVFTSSRTDAGVHAVRTSVHVRLQRENDIHPDLVTGAVNKYFLRKGIGIRVQSTHAVPEWFCARKNALSRTYLYRFAVLKKQREINPIISSKFMEQIPVTEHDRTFFIVDGEVDIEKMKEAASLFQGTKNFYSFMAKASHQPSYISTVRTMYSLTITPGEPFMPDHDPASQLYNYWNVTCCGRAFLYRQIRRTVGVLLAVGKNVMTLEDVRLLLDKPVPESWNPRAVCVPSCGLYLLDVQYNPRHFQPFCETLDDEDERVTYASLG